eukprot:TRINITY_DN2289_c0_g1_i2.p3 TRINITY_DN2289_c0_g1~~TRINITY_DN2289_c0_g1_i2.p3  ORF type:complete len:131 (-),score=4.20 TRINITY_DN2289_c0_g1_i2:1265-1657(-)
MCIRDRMCSFDVENSRKSDNGEMQIDTKALEHMKAEDALSYVQFDANDVKTSTELKERKGKMDGYKNCLNVYKVIQQKCIMSHQSLLQPRTSSPLQINGERNDLKKVLSQALKEEALLQILTNDGSIAHA